MKKLALSSSEENTFDVYLVDDSGNGEYVASVNGIVWDFVGKSGSPLKWTMEKDVWKTIIGFKGTNHGKERQPGEREYKYVSYAKRRERKNP